MAESTLCERVLLATRWTETELSQILGVSRALVSKILHGDRREYLTPKQRAAVLRELRLQGAELAELIIELELTT